MKTKPTRPSAVKKSSHITEVLRAARRAQNPAQLFSMLTEEHIFTAGQPIYVVGSMGMANVTGTFGRITSGGYAVIKDKKGIEHTVLPQAVHPLRPGSPV